MRLIRKFRRGMRNFISTKPLIYCPLARMGKNGFRVVTHETDLVIEGYPRSGNSYVEAAFRVSQRPGINLAHHTHAAANVLRAAKLNKPCYVLIRAPQDAAISLVIQEPNVQDLKLALLEYERFYKSIAPVLDRICLVPFEIATQDFNTGVKHLNELYKTDFAFLPEGVNRDEIMATVDKISRERKTVRDGVEPYSPKATDAVRQFRQDKQAQLRNQLLREPDVTALLERCNSLYHEVSSKSKLSSLVSSPSP